MSSTRFVAILPKTMQIGDKVQIKGLVNSNAEVFSINFANETSSSPQNIAYHFKWILTTNIIVEDYKVDGEWMNPKETESDSLDGPEFALEFSFQDDAVYVYLVHEDGHNMITHFQPECELSEIASVQVWGDVEKITQLTFFYN